MMAFIGELIGTQPILALFLAVGLGYAVGQINILGFSLGMRQRSPTSAYR